MTHKTFLVVESCSTPTVSLTEGDVIEIADKALAADLERGGYIARHKNGLTVSVARKAAVERRAQERAAAEAEAEAAERAAAEAEVEPQSE
ncbi:MAG: hypothetical protein AAGK03_03565 [Pseudomonadota bacterium]